jgi:ABC-type multidrug transport system permease subunit
MQGWLRGASAFNPITYVIEGIRSLILDGWVAEKLLACIVVTLAVSVVVLGLSVRSIRTYGA